MDNSMEMLLYNTGEFSLDLIPHSHWDEITEHEDLYEKSNMDVANHEPYDTCIEIGSENAEMLEWTSKSKVSAFWWKNMSGVFKQMISMSFLKRGICSVLACPKGNENSMTIWCMRMLLSRKVLWAFETTALKASEGWPWRNYRKLFYPVKGLRYYIIHSTDWHQDNGSYDLASAVVWKSRSRVWTWAVILETSWGLYSSRSSTADIILIKTFKLTQAHSA